jgi:hypothetical protein
MSEIYKLVVGNSEFYSGFLQIMLWREIVLLAQWERPPMHSNRSPRLYLLMDDRRLMWVDMLRF